MNEPGFRFSGEVRLSMEPQCRPCTGSTTSTPVQWCPHGFGVYAPIRDAAPWEPRSDLVRTEPFRLHFHNGNPEGIQSQNGMGPKPGTACLDSSAIAWRMSHESISNEVREGVPARLWPLSGKATSQAKSAPSAFDHLKNHWWGGDI
jgi:hypothetical protein